MYVVLLIFKPNHFIVFIMVSVENYGEKTKYPPPLKCSAYIHGRHINEGMLMSVFSFCRIIHFNHFFLEKHNQNFTF